MILVDQLRFPQWFSPAPRRSVGLPPNLQRLRQGAVSFARHYTASNDCTPARAALLTGLYTHQTGCMITGGSTLDPGFPTWGTMLREHGYHTRWSASGTSPTTTTAGRQPRANGALERYGFAGGTYPSPDGAPGQGWRVDPRIARQFADWFADGGRRRAVVHDRLVRQPARHRLVVRVERPRPRRGARAPRMVQRLPPNFETPELLLERRKPRLQRSLAGDRGRVVRAGPVHRPRSRAAGGWRSSTST